MKLGTTRPSSGAHPGTVSVENSGYAHLHAVIAVVGHGHGFGEPFGFVVNSARANRVYIAPVAFGLRVNQRVAVYL